MLFQVAARDSREKKILKSCDLKRKRQILQKELFIRKRYMAHNKKLRAKREKLLSRAVRENKTYDIPSSRFDCFQGNLVPPQPKYYIN